MNALLLGIRSFFPSPEGLPKRKVSEEQDRAGVGPQGAGGSGVCPWLIHTPSPWDPTSAHPPLLSLCSVLVGK